MIDVRFTAYGRAQGKGSKRALPIRSKVGPDRIAIVDGNAKAAPWARVVSSTAAEAMNGEPLMRGPVTVSLAFYFARPKGHYGTGRNATHLRLSAPKLMSTMPDIDKLARCALDALTGTIFADDSQVCRLDAVKNYSEPERLEVVVLAL